jgi:Domain of unknown function (DUF4389)
MPNGEDPSASSTAASATSASSADAGSDTGGVAPPAAGVPPPPVAPPPPMPAASVRPSSARLGGYPIDLGVEVPEHIARWRPLAQWILAIPLLIVAYVYGIAAQVFAFVGWFVALFTGQLPDALGDVIAGYYRFAWRVYSYCWFLRSAYPRFAFVPGYDEAGGDPAWFEVRRGSGLSRMSVLFRIILIIPQAIVLLFVGIAAYAAMFVAFFAVLITGRWPRGLRDFVVGVCRWAIRVNAWFYLLADPYPPFSLR